MAGIQSAMTVGRPEGRSMTIDWKDPKDLAKVLAVMVVLAGIGLLIKGAWDWRNAETMVQLDKAKTLTGAGAGMLKLTAAVGLVWYCCFSGRLRGDIATVRNSVDLGSA